jgi:uncharacterized protein YdaT
MSKSSLPHAEYIAKQLRVGHRAEAIKAHNEHLDAEFARAKTGAVINLSDLMAGAEAFVIDDIERKS